MARKKKPRQVDCCRSGATMVEFAFGFLLFLVLVLGVMEFGRAVWIYTTVSYAAREGARFAVVHGETNPVTNDDGDDITSDQIEEVVKRNAIGLDRNKIVVSPSWTPDNSRGSIVEVEVSYPFETVTGSLIIPQRTLTLASRSRMIVAN